MGTLSPLPEPASRGLAALLATRSAPVRASTVSFDVVQQCVQDALTFRLAGLADERSLSLFPCGVLRRPTSDDITIACWTQSLRAGAAADVVIVLSPNDGALYVDGQPLGDLPRDRVVGIAVNAYIPPELLPRTRRES